MKTQIQADMSTVQTVQSVHWWTRISRGENKIQPPIYSAPKHLQAVKTTQLWMMMIGSKEEHVRSSKRCKNQLDKCWHARNMQYISYYACIDSPVHPTRVLFPLWNPWVWVQIGLSDWLWISICWQRRLENAWKLKTDFRGTIHCVNRNDYRRRVEDRFFSRFLSQSVMPCRGCVASQQRNHNKDGETIDGTGTGTGTRMRINVDLWDIDGNDVDDEIRAPLPLQKAWDSRR